MSRRRAFSSSGSAAIRVVAASIAPARSPEAARFRASRARATARSWRRRRRSPSSHASNGSDRTRSPSRRSPLQRLNPVSRSDADPDRRSFVNCAASTRSLPWTRSATAPSLCAESSAFGPSALRKTRRHWRKLCRACTSPRSAQNRVARVSRDISSPSRSASTASKPCAFLGSATDGAPSTASSKRPRSRQTSAAAVGKDMAGLFFSQRPCGSSIGDSVWTPMRRDRLR